MLVGTHDGGIDHGVFVVCILSQVLEEPLPDPFVAPVGVAGMHHAEIPKAGWQVPPGDAGAVAVKDCIHKQSIVFGGNARLTGLAGQQIFDALPLVVS